MSILFVGNTPEDISELAFESGTGATAYNATSTAFSISSAEKDYRPVLTGTSADFWFHTRMYFTSNMAGQDGGVLWLGIRLFR